MTQRDLIQSVIADMDLDPDSLLQVEEAFKILQTGFDDQQQRESLDQIRTQLEAIEGGKIIDI